MTNNQGGSRTLTGGQGRRRVIRGDGEAQEEGALIILSLPAGGIRAVGYD